MDNAPAKNDNVLFRLGSEFVGGAAGGIIGFVIAGPTGAIIGGAVSPLISEFSKRLLSSRQKARVGATLIYAKQTIEQRIKEGRQPNLEFFEDKNNNSRPDVEEIWEGVLLNAQQEYEERKVPYYANLMANIAFESNFDKARANFLLKLAKNLSYRQLCLIAMLSDINTKNTLRESDYRGDASSISQHLASILHEIMEMYNYGIVNIPNDTLLGLSDVAPRQMNVQGAGLELGKLMELDKIPNTDIRELATSLH